MNTSSKPKVFITGADGFIGSHVASLFSSEGYDVTAMCLYNSFGRKGWLDSLSEQSRARMSIVSGDIRDASQTRSLMKGCRTVVHLAALIGIPYSYHAPASYVETNIIGTMNVLDAARDHGVDRVIVTSTSEVYGTARFVPITEEHPLGAQSPYAATKIAADQLSLAYHKSFGTPVTVIRPFNTYGPCQSLRAVIPTIISQLARGRRTLSLGSLEPTRDLTFVEDTARGFLRAATAKNIDGMVINLGTGYEISIGDLARRIAELMGVTFEFAQDKERVRPAASEVLRLLSDNRLARELLGWTPEFGGSEGLSRGLLKTIEWMSAPENLGYYPEGEHGI